MRPAPRLFGICASGADTVAVIRRGPSNWTHLGLWDPVSGEFESGSWLHARVYQQCCDISPDGRYLCYFALNGGAPWSAGFTYIAVSRLPWFTALAAWRTPGTYTWGAHFVDDPTQWAMPEPEEGDDVPLRRRYGMVMTHPQDFAVERRRGWSDLPGSPEPTADIRGKRRATRCRVGRPRPHQLERREHDVWLVASSDPGRSMDERSRRPPAYDLRDGATGSTLISLDGVQWADWARDGQLLVATTDGRLQIRDGATAALRWDLDLAELRPTPRKPPPAARHWADHY